MNFTFTTADLLTAGPPVIAHGCNTRGAMGAGIAAQVAQRYPLARDQYAAACRRNEFIIGQAQLVHVLDATCVKTDRVIFNLGTQRNPGADATYWAVFLSFANMAEQCAVLGIDLVGIPRIGCGIGGLQWDRVADRIEAAIQRSTHPGLTIAVHDLPSQAVDRDADLALIRKHGGLSDAEYDALVEDTQ